MVVVAIGATVAAIAASTQALASEGDSRDDANRLQEHLTGYNENPLAISTTGEGQFRAQINDDTQEITYELSYTNLEGAVTQAHIHFGSR